MWKIGEKCGKVRKSGKKYEIVLKREEKWLKLGKVGKSGEKWEKVAKSWEKLE